MVSYWHKYRSPRVIVKGQSKKHVETRISLHKKKGYVPLMELKEDYDMDGKPFYVCVMEHPKLKEKLKAKSPSH